MMLPAPKVRGKTRPTLALHERAIEDLRFIRETMERSESFTAVSGLGGIAMGVIALVAAGVSTTVGSPLAWATVWMAAAALSFVVALALMARKARAAGLSLLSGRGRKFAFNVSPPLVVGALLTIALLRSGQTGLLPGVWLLLYGAGVVTGGAFSVRIVPLLGLFFIALGTAALFSPAGLGTLYMALGFGCLHLSFGFVIWRKHGG